MRNGREDGNGRRYTTFGFDKGKRISKIFCVIELFFIFETKCRLSTSVFNQLTVIEEYTRHKYMELAIVATVNWLTSLKFPKISKQNFMYFGHKHVET